jgi:hypothetical protein
MPKDDLAQIRALRDDLRALKKQYPELTTPAAQARLAEYMESETQKEHRMPAKGDRLLGENLVNVTFKIPESALATIEQHHRTLQRMHRWQRINKSDCLRDIFMRAIDALENPPQQFPVVIDPGPELSRVTPAQVEPAATSAGGAIPPPPAYEAQVMTTETFPEPPMEHAVTDTVTDTVVTDTVTDTPLEHPLDEELDDALLALAVDVTQESVVPAVAVEPARPKAAAKRKTTRTTAKGRT